MIPPLLIKSLSKLDHFDPEKFLSAHALENQLVSVHMNSGKPILDHGSWPADFTEPPFEIAGPVPWATDAFYLSARPSFTLDPLFHAGLYYVQEASGMFLSFAINHITDLTQKLKVLDLCAAPGGKSTLIQSLISPESLLVSNEVIKTRVPVLNQNMTKWGRLNGIISNNDPAQFKLLSGFFDLVVVDAPCSGSGLFRKDPKAADSWNPDLVRLCSQRQQRILADTWDCLKEDGFLIYTTCSYSEEENEEIVDYVFGQYACNSIPLSPDPAWNIVETRSKKAGAYGYRFYPDKLKGEGFFLSVIQKKQAARALRSNKPNRKNVRVAKSAEQQMSVWLKEIPMQFLTVGDGLHALVPGLADDFEVLKNALYLKKAGIRLGKAGESEWIPDQELAMSNLLHSEAASIELSKENALHYLRGETFEAGKPEKGWRVVNYRGQRLGWVKLLDTRMNNYYPKSWRIRQ
jgi:16S rRNA C967 or C1407 C5-methylase (RsmB/RsmF family)/NOL1/NOP2/fmu family ribosome biogenesis protein